jgi:tRNA-2-methylthio-N6-dimethylallyladenosine synthase
MNRHDAEVLAGHLAAGGWAEAASPEEADAVLYFTCSVREHAEARVWSHLGTWRKKREEGRLRALGVVGCMAERLGERIRKRCPHVDIVAGPGRLAEVPELLDRVVAGDGPALANGEPPDAERGCLDPARARRPNAFQAYLAVMRGCNGGCTYCVVPRVRGPERSVPPEDVERAAQSLIEQGAVEITLLGQNIDRYGLTLEPNSTLAELMRRLAALPGLARLRFVTSHPRDITDDLLRAVADHANVMPYLHVPAQSGSDRVLAAMRRDHTRARYAEVVELARRIVPGVEIASDFIVGFPGETASDFEDTLSLVREARFQNAFIFKYSPRPGTSAARLADDVPAEVKKERHRILSELQLSISREKNSALVGSEVEVLAEGPSRTDPARFTGRTPTARIAAFRADADPTGRIVTVRVEDATALVLLGRIAS